MELSRKISKRRYFKSTIVYFLTCCMFFNTSLSVALAGPEGAQVVNGQVSFQQSSYNTTITASDKSIINYSSFDIARPEIVQFIQPGSSASVLNRILSANPTNINGTLLANGRVFFVNPAGVYIGAGARINVNQLVASGLNITNSDFINGQYNFAGGEGAVINSGDISAEKVYLIGRQVANFGSISCPAGYVVMASGDRVFLGEPGTDVVLEVDAPSLPESAETIEGSGVLNEGTIDAAGGTIVLAAGDIYSQAISNTGSLSASFEAGEAGQIKLAADEGIVINTGTIEASGSKGGRVEMEGARVGQFGTIHADGIDSDGGNIDLTASDVVALSSDSLTTANAGTNGDGGEVIVYSPETALFRDGARIEAIGGQLSGDGGFVEISGQDYVEVQGSVKTLAPNGMVGTYLIDPGNVEIRAAAESEIIFTPGVPDQFQPANENAATSVLNIGDTSTPGTLLGELASNNVEVLTANATPGDDGFGDGDITVVDSIDYDGIGTRTLTLTADDDIFINGSILDGTLGGDTLNLVLTATANVDISAAIATNSGNFTSSGVDFDNTGGTVTTGGGGIAINHTGTVILGADLDTSGTTSGTSTSITVASNAAEIQDAIDIAPTGATITVDDGIYTEDLTIDKANLTLQSVNGRDDTTIQLVDVVGINIGSSGSDFTLGGDVDDDPDVGVGNGFEIKGGGATTFNIQLTNAPSNVEISWNTIDTTGSASMGISVGVAGASGLNINNNTFIAESGDGSIWGPEVVDVSVTDNTFTGPAPKDISGYAVYLFGVSGTSVIQDNTINDYCNGVGIFNGSGVSGLTISGNEISACTNGLRFGEYNAGSLSSDNITDITVRNNTVTGGTNAIHLYDPFGGNGSHVLANNIAVYDNDLSSNTYGVKNELPLANGTVLDASGNWWGSADGPKIGSNTYNVLSQGVEIYEAVPDTVEYVRWLDSGDDGNPDKGFQPTGSLFAPVTNITDNPDTYYSSIGSGITLATADDTLKIENGTFSEAATVDKNLTLTVPTGTAEMTSLSSNGSTTTGLSGLFAADSFQFVGGVTLAGHASLSTGTGTGNIDFQSTLDGSTDFTENLTLTAGTGNISFGDDGTDVVGGDTALGDVIINSAQNVTADAAFIAKSLEQQAGTGKTWFKSTITTKGATTTKGGKVDITTTGNIEIGDKVDATGGAAASPGQDGGNVTLSGNNITVDEIDTSGTNATGPGDEPGGLGGNIQITSTTMTTLNDNLTAAGGSGFGAGSDGAGGNITLNGPTEYTAPIAVSTGTTTGDISFDSNVKGGYLLTLTAGTGNIDFLSTVGATTPLSGLLVTSAATLDFDNTVAVDDESIDIDATTIGIDNTVTTTNAGTVTITNAGTLTIAEDADMILDGAFTVDGAGPVTTEGNISMNNASNIIFDGAGLVTISAGDATLNSNGGDIRFDGDVTGAGLLTLTAGAGNIDFTSTIGSAGALSGLAVTSAATLDFDNTVAVDDESIDIDATTIGIDNTVTTTNAGTVTITNAGTLTIAEDADMILDGAFTVDGAGPVTTEGNISMNNASNIIFDGAGLVTIGAGDATLNSNGGDIRFDGDVTGAGLLTLTAGAGNIDFTSTIGSAGALSGLAVTSAATLDFDNTVAVDDESIDIDATTIGIDNTVTTTNAGTVTITNAGTLTIAEDADMILDGAFTVDGAGPVTTEGNISMNNASNIIFDGAGLVTIGAGDATLNSNGGDIRFDGDVTGAGLLTLTAGAGNIDFTSTIGSAGALSGLAVTSAATLDFDNTVEVDDENIDIDADGYVTFDNTVDTNNGGTATISNTGLLTISGPMSLDGAFDQDGAGGVDLDASITTTGDTIDFDGDIDLGADVTLDTTNSGAVPAGASVTLAGKVDEDFKLTVNAGTGGTATFGDMVGDTTPLSGLVVDALNIDIDEDVTVAVDIELNNNTTVADGKTLEAGINLKMGAGKTLTGEGDLILEATNGGITEIGGDNKVQIKMAADDKTLTLNQNDLIDMTNFYVTNKSDVTDLSATDLVANSTGGSVSALSGDDNPADSWKSITATADSGITLTGIGSITANTLTSTNGNIGIKSGTAVALNGPVTTQNGGGVTVTAQGDVTTQQPITTEALSVTTNSNIEIHSNSGDLNINNNLTAKGGGVKLIADGGKIYTSGDTLNVAITGYSDNIGTNDVGVDLPAGADKGKAAIVIRSEKDLILGSTATLTAKGSYDDSVVDDREGVYFLPPPPDSPEAGEPIDVAIYLGSFGTVSVNEEGDVTVNSTVSMTDNGTMVIDAYDTVNTFGINFTDSDPWSDITNSLEVVSRISQTLDDAADNKRLPHADEARSDIVPSWFGGEKYVLRGKDAVLAEVLGKIEPVPLVLPKPLAPEDQGQVQIERRDAELLGLGDKPELARAYPPSLNTDLNLDKAAQILYVLMPILRDSSRIATLDRIVVEIWQDVDQPIAPEQEAMIAQRMSGTPAEEWVAALTEYVNVMSTMVGRPKTESVLWVMQTYVIPQAEEGLLQDQTVAFLEAQID